MLRTEPFAQGSSLERRGTPRRTPATDELLSQVRLRAGRELVVINISDAGIMVEGPMRLLPGAHADVHLVTAQGRVLVRSRVVRACVHRVSAACIVYRGALVFERAVGTAAAGYAIPGASTGPAGAQGNPYPDPAPAVVRSLGPEPSV